MVLSKDVDEGLLRVNPGNPRLIRNVCFPSLSGQSAYSQHVRSFANLAQRPTCQPKLR
jgi:hypothetical protein